MTITMKMTKRVIDLHGKSHDEAKLLVEEEIINLSLVGPFQAEIITGNSQILKDKIIKEVLEEHQFNYYFNPNNFGVIYVDFISF